MANPEKIAVGVVKVVGGVAMGLVGLLGVDNLAERAMDLISEGGRDVAEGVGE